LTVILEKHVKYPKLTLVMSISKSSIQTVVL